MLLAPLTLAGQESAPGTLSRSTFEEHVAPFLRDYCVSCHNDDLQTADLSFEPFLADADVGQAAPLWVRVAERLRADQMPPRGRPQPADDAVARVLAWAEAADGGPAPTQSNPGPGRVTARRLNRTEYNNTVRSLLGIHGRPADDFPADDSGYGFDNNGDVLSISPLLMEKLIAAAQQVSRDAVFGPPLPDEPYQLAHYMARRSHDADDSLDSADTLPFSIRGALYGSHLFPWTAEYELRFRVANYRQRAPGPEGDPRRPPDSPPLPPEDLLEEMRLAAPPVPVVATLDGQVFREEIIEGVNAFGYERGEFVTRVSVDAGEHDFRVSYPHLADIVDPQENMLPDGRRVMYIDYLDIVGPFDPSPDPPASHDTIFICQHRHGAHGADGAADSEHDEECAGEIVTHLARRAYRRPVAAEEVAPLVDLIRQAEDAGDSFEEGVRVAVQAVLLSPHFLFRIEQDAETGSADGHPVTDHELASRLSYFLWADMPDDILFDLADRGQLGHPDVLQAQVQRMLADPRASALVDTFAEQWLQLRNLDRTKPDPALFPDVDDELRAAMRQETDLFLHAVIREDRSLLDLIDAPFTFLNGPLAHHYDITGVTGEAFQRVPLDGTHRSGLLTQASVLTVSSYPTRTSPVLRGKWVLQNLLGAPPPDPPAGVPPLDDAAVGTTVSLRAQLEQHRANASCAVCHDQIDPLGFGLERYDATGAWRTHDGPFEIDDSGTLPDGTTFRGSLELKGILRSQSDAFTRNLADKLLTYALGRGLEPYDTAAVDALTERVAAADHRFSSLVQGIVESQPFRMRRPES
ncbi:MAG: DUF1592 domain-containing protein [Acidobacteria bacterium]|nr:DUF1592 domain-containing protein [Acidobacteriota bacterium]